MSAAVVVALGSGAVVLAVVALRRSLGSLSRAPGDGPALGEMDRLCPEGWEARIVVRGAPRGMRAGGGHPVEIEWSELGGRDLTHGSAAVTRRVSAGDLSSALDAMVDSRRVDRLLEPAEGRPQPRG